MCHRASHDANKGQGKAWKQSTENEMTTLTNTCQSIKERVDKLQQEKCFESMQQVCWHTCASSNIDSCLLL